MRNMQNQYKQFPIKALRQKKSAESAHFPTPSVIAGRLGLLFIQFQAEKTAFPSPCKLKKHTIPHLPGVCSACFPTL
jgi:hypothetical protein